MTLYLQMIFTYIKAAKFFPKYAPKVVNWKYKLSGKNSKGSPLTFTDADNKAIKAGLKKLFKDLN